MAKQKREKRELALDLWIEREATGFGSGRFFHVRGQVVQRYPDDSTNVGKWGDMTSADRDDNPRLTAQGDENSTRERPVYGMSFECKPFSVDGAGQARRIANRFATFERGMAKIKALAGPTGEPSSWFLRAARVLGASYVRVHWPKDWTDHLSAGETETRALTDGDAANVIYRLLYQVAKRYGKPETETVAS